MSYPYPGGGGYPGQQPQQPGTGFPTPGGYPAANTGYGQPAPYPSGPGNQPPYPTSASGGLPYAYAPPTGPPDIGFGANPPPAGNAGYNTPYQQPPAVAYPGQPPAQPGYPGQPPAQPGYPGQPPAQPGYPGHPPAQAGYPGQPPAQAGYPGQPPAQAGYPGQPPAQPGYAGQPPAQAGYPGQPPAQAGYPGQPPAQAGYPGAQTGAAGAGYGAGQHSSPAPPVAAMRNMSMKVARGEGTVKPHSPFNAEHDAQMLRKAMKGIGTDEKAIIDVICYRSNAQRQEIKQMFKTAYGKDLIKELKGELSGRFEDLILGLLMPPLHFDADQIHKSIKGAGTDEGCLIEILTTRTNAQIMEIKANYKTLFKHEMEKELMSDTSGHFKRLLVSLASAGRRETAPVDIARAKQDAMDLKKAGEGRLGTDESKFNMILCINSHEQLQAIFNEYRNVSSKTIEQAIKSEMSGDLEQGMLAVVRASQNLPAYFAERLHKSMKGAGTKDSTLIRVMITRSEVDMVQIKQYFQSAYGKSLESWIGGDASGDYKRALLALCGVR